MYTITITIVLLEVLFEEEETVIPETPKSIGKGGISNASTLLNNSDG